MDQNSQYAIETLINLLYLIEVQRDSPQKLQRYLEMTKEPLRILKEAAEKGIDAES